MENFKKISGKLILCLCEIAVGIVLLTDPAKFTGIVITAAGVILCVLGALAVLSYFRMDPEEAALSQELTRGLIALAAGIFCVYKSNWFITTFPLLTVIYGVALLLVGIVKLQWTVDMFRLKRGYWVSGAVTAALSIILAIIVLLRPFAVLETLWTFTAIVLIITGVADGVTALTSQRRRGGAPQE